MLDMLHLILIHHLNILSISSGQAQHLSILIHYLSILTVLVLMGRVVLDREKMDDYFITISFDLAAAAAPGWSVACDVIIRHRCRTRMRIYRI